MGYFWESKRPKSYDYVVGCLREELENGYLDVDRPDYEILADLDDNLHEIIDSALIYHSDVMAYWNGETNMSIDLAECEDISDAIRQSTYWQLAEEWCSAPYDALDGWLESQGEDVAALVIDGKRDEALELVVERRELKEG